MSSSSPVKRSRAEPTAAVSIPTSVLTKLASMQDALNKFIDPKWRENRQSGDWALAITLEAAELIDSYPWKWWKATAKPADFDNVRIELVDILHFSLSGLMQVGVDEAAAKESSSAPDGFLAPLTNTRNAVATFRQVIRLADANRFGEVTTFVLMAAADLDFNLVAYYLAKHTLNHVRQLGGYKEGKYKKVDDAGTEDNALLHKCMEGVSMEAVLGDFEGVGDGILGKVYAAFQVPLEDRKTMKSWLMA